MAERMHRARILFPEDAYRRLKAAAQEQQRSVGSLAREAAAERFGDEARRKRVQAALRLTSMRLPVTDWPQMEEGIMRGATADE